MTRQFSHMVICMMQVCALVSCTSSWNDPNLPFEATNSYLLNVNTETIMVPQNGKEHQISINAQCYWSAKTTADWLNLSSNVGKGNTTLILSIDPNMITTDIRNASVIISNGIEDFYIPVFQDGADWPTISALRFSHIERNSVVCSFSFSSNHVYIIDYGVCYSSSTIKPYRENSATLEVHEFYNKNGTPTITIPSLKSNTTYYVRAFVISSLGIQYSDTYQFITSE